MRRLMKTTCMIALLLSSCAPMKFAPQGNFANPVGTNQAAAQCKAEFMRDFRNRGSQLSMALDARSAVTDCMAGKGYARVD